MRTKAVGERDVMATRMDARALRNALGHFATGVVVVTASTDGLEPVAMTVSSFNAVSLDPPLVLFSVCRTAPSLARLVAAEQFGISVLRHEQSDLSTRFSHAKGSKWGGLRPRVGTTGCPLIDAALATFECSLFATYDGGDHLIIVGRVQCFEWADDGHPLVFFRGGYHSINASAPNAYRPVQEDQARMK